MVDSPMFPECPFDDPFGAEPLPTNDELYELVGDYDPFGAWDDDSYSGPT